jgi:hypothetical protein
MVMLIIRFLTGREILKINNQMKRTIVKVGSNILILSDRNTESKWYYNSFDNAIRKGQASKIYHESIIASSETLSGVAPINPDDIPKLEALLNSGVNEVEVSFGKEYIGEEDISHIPIFKDKIILDQNGYVILSFPEKKEEMYICEYYHSCENSTCKIKTPHTKNFECGSHFCKPIPLSELPLNVAAAEILKANLIHTLDIIEGSPLHIAVIKAMEEYSQANIRKELANFSREKNFIIWFKGLDNPTKYALDASNLIELYKEYSQEKEGK